MNLNNTDYRQIEFYQSECCEDDDSVILTNFFDYEFSGDVVTCDRRHYCDEDGVTTITRFHNAAITKVVYNDPAVIVFWNDGTKTIAKCHNENYDKEKGLYVAVLKKIMGNDKFRTFSTDWTSAEQFVTLKDVRKKHK